MHIFNLFVGLQSEADEVPSKVRQHMEKRPTANRAVLKGTSPVKPKLVLA